MFEVMHIIIQVAVHFAVSCWLSVFCTCQSSPFGHQGRLDLPWDLHCSCTLPGQLLDSGCVDT